MRILSTIIALASALSPAAASAAADVGNGPVTVKNYLFGHAYLEDKNGPVRGLSVTAEKDGKVIGSGTTNESGLYEMTLPDRSDYLNVCVSSWTSKLKGVRFCETVSMFQKVGTVVGTVEFRQTEQDFYIGAGGENLNERYLSEIRNEPTEKAYGEYERILSENREAEEERQAEEAAEEKADEEKAKYRMPANTDMTGPVKEMQVVGSVRIPKEADPATFSVKVYSHGYVTLRDKLLGKARDFNFTVMPKDGPVFLHPLSMEISSTETAVTPDGGRVPKWKPVWVQLSKEKNIVAAEVVPYVPGPADVRTVVRGKFPIFGILAAVLAVMGGFLAVARGKTRKYRYDYE